MYFNVEVFYESGVLLQFFEVFGCVGGLDVFDLLEFGCLFGFFFKFCNQVLFVCVEFVFLFVVQNSGYDFVGCMLGCFGGEFVLFENDYV